MKPAQLQSNVLEASVSDLETQLKSAIRDIPDFPKPERWTAPYLQYSPGWWRSFVPEEAKDVVAVN